MDPSKKIGKIKEQIKREHISRRTYPQKWGKLVEPEVTRFYNPNEINRQLKESLKYQEICPFRYTGEGESYFVSRDMYESLCGICRCGRPRSEAHLINCLQKELNRYGSESIEEPGGAQLLQDHNPKLPKTSNGVCGFMSGKKPIYQQWEQSMKYISPANTMPGFRISTKPFNAIIIG